MVGLGAGVPQQMQVNRGGVGWDGRQAIKTLDAVPRVLGIARARQARQISPSTLSADPHLSPSFFGVQSGPQYNCYTLTVLYIIRYCYVTYNTDVPYLYCIMSQEGEITDS